MVKAVIMPKLGQSEETVKIVKWRKQLGETVAKGDILFEIETDKAVLEVESFYAGTLLKIVAGEGVTVPVQTTVAFMGDPGEPVPEVVLPPVASQEGGSRAGPAQRHRAQREPREVRAQDARGIRGSCSIVSRCGTRRARALRSRSCSGSAPAPRNWPRNPSSIPPPSWARVPAGESWSAM